MTFIRLSSNLVAHSSAGTFFSRGFETDSNTFHLDRPAYVYVRQSSPKQVRDNKESQRYQAQLAERAAALGWAKEQIFVIDSDTGMTGKNTESRDGYKTLIAEISLGKVGIIFGYEVSRLARNNSNWYQLLDLAAVFGTLIADADGIYDPRLYNDRLLLGLKGAMSEAELHSMKLRLEAGRLSQVARGELEQRLPPGLERVDHLTVVKDPDIQVRETIELVFKKFADLGSCGKVLRYLAQEKIQLPSRHPNGRVIFKNPTYQRVIAIISNPAYAGAFVYGRLQTDHTRSGRRYRMPLEKWIHVQQDVYPAYITWQQYLDNMFRISQNFAAYINKPGAESKGAPRKGTALLQGLAICGVCGSHMKVMYSPAGRYFCDHLKKEVAGPRCPSHAAGCVDQAVSEAFFQAISPAQIDALEGVLAKSREEKVQIDRHWQRVLKRAEYAARQAQDRYEAVDARNRLVADTLESRWEERLDELGRLRKEYQVFSARQDIEDHVPEELRAQMRSIATSLPALWLEGNISRVRMKELLRCLIEKVVLVSKAADRIEARIVWASGACWPITVKKTMHTFSDSPDYMKIVSRIHKLWQQNVSDVEIAVQLTAEGFRSPRADRFLPMTVMDIRLARGWRRPQTGVKKPRIAPRGYVKTDELARRTGVGVLTILRCVRKGVVPRKYILSARGAYFFKDCEEVYQRINRRGGLRES